MKYTVLWQEKAEQSLAGIWMRSSDRDAVTRAAQEIDRELQTHPVDIGESRSSGERVFFSRPLGVAYSIRPGDMLVRVLRVWQIKRRGE